MMEIAQAPLIPITFDGQLVCSIQRIPANYDTIFRIAERMTEEKGIIIPGGIALPAKNLNDWKNQNWDEPTEPSELSDTYRYLKQFDRGYMARLLMRLEIKVKVGELRRINYWDGDFSKLRYFTLYEQFALLDTPLTAEKQASLYQIFPPGFGSMDSSRTHVTYFPLGNYECGGILLHSFR